MHSLVWRELHLSQLGVRSPAPAHFSWRFPPLRIHAEEGVFVGFLTVRLFRCQSRDKKCGIGVRDALDHAMCDRNSHNKAHTARTVEKHCDKNLHLFQLEMSMA